MPEYSVEGWPADAETLSVRLAQTKLPDTVRQALESNRRPALMLTTLAVDEDEIPVGASKIGGRPDLPPGFVWPLRPPYPDAEEVAERALEAGAYTMASAGVAPPWLTPAKGRKLIEKATRDRARMAKDFARMREESRREVARLKPDDVFTEEDIERYRAQVEGETFDLPPLPTLDEAERAGLHARHVAEATRSAFPLAFIAQLDLGTLSKQEGFDDALPGSGRLYVFYDLAGFPSPSDPASKPGHLVVHDDTPSGQLVRTDLPPALAEFVAFAPEAVLRPAIIEARAAVTIPPLETLPNLDIRLRGRQSAAYDEWLLGEVGWPGAPDRDRHQLGGWPRAVQMNMQAKAQSAANGIDAATMGSWTSKKAKAILAEAGAWHLLFQLGPDETIGNETDGSFNVLLRDEDLAARRFERAWVVYEQS